MKKKSLVGHPTPDATQYGEYIIDSEFETSKDLIKDFKDCEQVRITIEEI